MKLRVAGVVQDSIVDGPGLRLAIFCQGCEHACPGCHNPASHDPEGGDWREIDDLLAMLRQNTLAAGITLTGGEPFLQPAACVALARGAHALGKNVWTYTGYTLEQLLGEGNPERLALLGETDVLIDGPFLLQERTLELRFRGSRNQRMLKGRESLEAGKAIPYELPQW